MGGHSFQVFEADQVCGVNPFVPKNWPRPIWREAITPLNSRTLLTPTLGDQCLG